MGKQFIKENYNYTEIAKLLDFGFIGGIAKGKAEVGPRALGNRSIIADPRNYNSRERINGLIKKRAAFQPLAPICLENDFDLYFERFPTNIDLRFMLYAVKCKENALFSIPAVVHADNTARVQLVTKDNEFLFNLLTNFKKITGIGVLINTSFNGKNEPIVNDAIHAYQAYKKLDIDFLVLDNFLITKKNDIRHKSKP